MAKYSVVALRDGLNFSNKSFDRFGVPTTSDGGWDEIDENMQVTTFPGEPDYNTADLLDGMVDRWLVDGGSYKQTIRFIEDAAQLYKQRKLLFPVGFLWGGSALGKIQMRGMAELLEQYAPGMLEVREQFANVPFVARNDERDKQIIAFQCWRAYASIRLSQQGINGLDDVHDGHLQIMADALRPNGEWMPCIGLAGSKMLRSFVTAIAEYKGNPNFGAALGRIHYVGRSPRSWTPNETHQHLAWVEKDYERWLDESINMNRKGPRQGKRLLLEYLRSHKEVSCGNAAEVFSSRPMVSGLVQFASNWSTPGMRSYALGKVFDFATWLSDESRDDMGRPAFTLSLSARDVDQFRQAQPVPSKSQQAEVAARPMPQRYHQQLKEIITANDFAWPKSLIHGASGLPKHWFTWTDPVTGRGEPIFCEVLPRMLLLLLDLPLRTIQARRLDSGEGDEERWNSTSRLWEKNSGPTAGYWTRSKVSNRRRGAIRRIDGIGRDGGTVTGIYINSNKTQDRKVLFDENSGYEIPWEHDDVLDNLAAMRNWQKKYNPVFKPLPFDEVPDKLLSSEPGETVKGLQPDRFYLFRYPLNSGKRGDEAPPPYKALLQFFYDALSELERRLNEEDPGADIKIITKRDASGLPKGAVYTMHGMRSSTLTALYSEGVPIAVLSKLVAGHATILMTLKYIKYEPTHVSEILTEARRKALATGAEAFRKELSGASFEKAGAMAAYLVDDGVAQAKGPYAESSAWSAMDIGICPNGQTLCAIGGERTVSRRPTGGSDKSVYGPVPGGPRNCVRCRFFITGLPFLIALVGHANAISARTESVTNRIAQRDNEIADLKRRRHALTSANDQSIDPTDALALSDIRRRLLALEAEWEADEARRDQHLADFHATLTLVEKVRSLTRGTDGDTGAPLPMVLQEEGLPEVTGRESTRFELTDHVVQMSRFYPSLQSADIERERDGFIDRVLYQEGFVPFAMSPLSQDEKRKAADALAALLLSRLGALETENLIAGRKTLSELGLVDGFDETIRRSIGKPLDRLSLKAPANDQPLILDVNAASRS